MRRGLILNLASVHKNHAHLDKSRSIYFVGTDLPANMVLRNQQVNGQALAYSTDF